MPLINPNWGHYNEGQVVTSALSKCRSLVYPKNGSTRGSNLETATGTPVYNTVYPYTLTMIRARDGQQNTQVGQFFFSVAPGAATLAGFLVRLADHLARYHDVQVTPAATTLTIQSRFWGFTPVLAMSSGGMSIVVTTQTNALAPAPINPGTVVGAYPGPGPDRLLALPGSPAFGALVPGNAQFGIVVASMESPSKTTEDQILSVMFEGHIGVRLAGANPLLGSTTSMNLGLVSSVNPGRFSVGPADTNNVLVSIGGSQGYLYQGTVFQPEEFNVQPGQVFRMRIQS